MQGRREAHAAALHGPTEDAAARSVPGAASVVRWRGERAQEKIYDTNPVLSAKCSKGKKHKKHGKH